MKLEKVKEALLDKAQMYYTAGNYSWQTRPDIEFALELLEGDWSSYDDSEHNRHLGFVMALLWRCNVFSRDQLKTLIDEK
jgi:hypothetical protein